MGYSWRQVLGVLVLLRLLYVLLRPKRAVERLPAPVYQHYFHGVMSAEIGLHLASAALDLWP